MASIQILEICPVEAQIEDLSDDLTDSIRGGSIKLFTEAILDCVGDFLQDAASQDFNPFLSAGTFLKCVGNAFRLLEVEIEPELF